jgi:hypothetical protein
MSYASKCYSLGVTELSASANGKRVGVQQTIHCMLSVLAIKYCPHVRPPGSLKSCRPQCRQRFDNSPDPEIASTQTCSLLELFAAMPLLFHPEQNSCLKSPLQ